VHGSKLQQLLAGDGHHRGGDRPVARRPGDDDGTAGVLVPV